MGNPILITWIKFHIGFTVIVWGFNVLFCLQGLMDVVVATEINFCVKTKSVYQNNGSATAKMIAAITVTSYPKTVMVN